MAGSRRHRLFGVETRGLSGKTTENHGDPNSRRQYLNRGPSEYVAYALDNDVRFFPPWRHSPAYPNTQTFAGRSGNWDRLFSRIAPDTIIPTAPYAFIHVSRYYIILAFNSVLKVTRVKTNLYACITPEVFHVGRMLTRSCSFVMISGTLGHNWKDVENSLQIACHLFGYEQTDRS